MSSDQDNTTVDPSQQTSTTATTNEQPTEHTNKLPPLSAADFHLYNHMADHMQLFHNNFRQTWTSILAALSPSPPRSQALSSRQLLQTITSFTHHLTIHHTIEERHIFPVLATRMPEFEVKGALLEQHEFIHRGIEALEKYVEEVKGGERELVRGEIKGIMEGFGGVLWEHLDGEVQSLGAERMRLFWGKGEMRTMPM